MQATNTDTIPTGIPTGFADLDAALGTGGFPRGRLVDVFGAPRSGKRTVCLSTVRKAQARGLRAALVSPELEVRRAEALGIDLGRLVVSQPPNAEAALDAVEALVRTGAVDLVVVDAALGGMQRDDSREQQSLRHRLLIRSLRKLTSLAHAAGTTVVFCHDLPWQAGAAEAGLRFYASVRLDFRRLESGTTRVKVVKNKCAAPFESADLACSEVAR